MKKFDFPLVADVLFYTLAAWFVLVGVLRAAHVAGGVCFAAATLIALAFGGVLLFAFSLRRRRARPRKAEREEREKLMLHLALETDERVRAALLAALCADGKDAHCEGDALAADGTVVVPVFTMQPLSADTVARLLKTYKERPFLLACNALSPRRKGCCAPSEGAPCAARKCTNSSAERTRCPRPSSAASCRAEARKGAQTRLLPPQRLSLFCERRGAAPHEFICLFPRLLPRRGKPAALCRRAHPRIRREA